LNSNYVESVQITMAEDFGVQAEVRSTTRPGTRDASQIDLEVTAT